MRWQEAVGRIVKTIEKEPSIEGAFLGGSLVTQDWDEYSDIDLGIASKDTPEDLDRAFALRFRIAAAIGNPIHFLEKAWDHSRMIALLYSKAQFPPIGLELDLFFSQLQHISELMPGASFGVVLDCSGKLREQIDKLAQVTRQEQIKEELEQQTITFPFDANHALKAYARQDLFNFQAAVERMRTAIFSAAASRYGRQVRGSKRTFQHLSAAERGLIESSYCEFTAETVRRLVTLYISLLSEVQHQYGLGPQVEHLRATLPQVS